MSYNISGPLSFALLTSGTGAQLLQCCNLECHKLIALLSWGGTLHCEEIFCFEGTHFRQTLKQQWANLCHHVVQWDLHQKLLYWYLSLWKYGDSYFNKFLNFALDIPRSCSILFTDFRTVFVFALGRFVHIVENLFDHCYFKTVKWPKKYWF